jgi:DamX protein
MPSSPAPVEVATPGATPASRPPAAAAGEGQRLLISGRYPEAAQAFLGDWGQSSAGYTVEIEVACQADTVAKGAAAASGKSELAILPYDLKGRSCYLVVWGTYPDRTSAEAALRELPSLFQPPAAQPRVASRARVLELSRGKK